MATGFGLAGWKFRLGRLTEIVLREETKMITINSLSDVVASGAGPEELKPYTRVPSLIVEWDNAPGSVWVLRVCEYYGVRDCRWDYPEAAKWASTGGGEMSYFDHPVSEDPSVRGTSSATIRVDGDRLDYEVTLHNNSSDTWEDAWGWICLVHRWAGSFQANCELPVGDETGPWTPCVSLPAPKERWLKWCPVLQHSQIAERIGRNQAHMWQPHIEARMGTVRAWRMSLNGPMQQFVEMSSPNAIIVGWSHWPCTDMGLYFGDIEPGQSEVVRATLGFHEERYQPI